ncbi:FAD-dependent oxidoreductase [Stackebrandtia nassauensis]|uniref:Monooxygenase FAD-binding protein n=1 Tax=Stackebrandtia nassauensis (strain DSM 44728 / CIP 108903 / NRRL B-16338 / NBRC 102104 / LLR-40K-21) TaxID=446470 RepID=D3PUF0_STANL|nr:NAD(P)/FAD-dependent oxidoreductase [Stackebrandtia nassauensis]ADD42963.1 monooxygenase FAD-binding protein [Stackebrandtia nassauensis DSM 44728]
MRVIVIGAGLGGLTLAHGLRQAGIDVAVYEQDEPQGRPQGISLHFDDRAITALRACLPSGHVAMIEATLGGPRNATQVLSEVDGELAVTGTRPSDGSPGRARPGHQAHRPLLRQVLLTGLEDTVRFGARLTRFATLADGTVTAHFADGSSDTANVLVAADGIGSAVRRQYLPDARVVDAGKRVLMGATPLRAVSATGLPELIGDNPATLQCGDAMIALGVLRFATPPLDAARQWLPAANGAAIAEAEDFVMWALPVAQDRLGAAASPDAIWQRARGIAADLHPTLGSIVDAAWPDVTFAHRVGVIPPLPPWPATAVTLIGDAIHLAPGFGGNLAMRDAQRLRDALVRAVQGEQDLLGAIGSYEDTMRRENFPAVAGSRA